MKYQKASDVLPGHLLTEIQKYVEGTLVYIPSREGSRRAWGERSGARQEIQQRNAQIRARHRGGEAAEQLAYAFCLSVESIKKIIYQK